MKKTFLVLLLFALPLFADALSYLGDKSCQQCHLQTHALWQGSHHDLAMQKADAKTVLGDFNKATFDYNGIITTFFKKAGKFMVRTDGPDGKLHDYEISHAFGVYPLQQYLIPFPDGKFQVLDIAWDTRKKEEGGERWFHLHPNDNVTANDPLHWTGPYLNWNFMCADCHSTNLRKNYDPGTRKFSTTYDLINVSCEACHGPGSEHAAWAHDPEHYKGMLRKGLTIDLSMFGKERWKIDPENGRPVLLTEIDHSQVDLCAKCHSRRSQLDDDFVPGDRFADHYLPLMLTDPLYFPDGKIEDEVYVYASFLQSKMYADGVTCTDCHDAHSLKRHAPGDQVCNKCHRRVDYDVKRHHFHKTGSATCIDCHMPSRIYMGNDERNDHSFRVPRPDLSVGTDTPNACNNCHKDKTAAWAADSMKRWYGKIPKGYQQFAHQFTALRSGSDQAPQALYDVLTSDAPDIAKATATVHLGDYPTRQTYTTTLQMLHNSDENIRLSALNALEVFPPDLRIKQTFELLDDPVKIVRTEAARQLSAVPQGDLDVSTRTKLQKGVEEYRQTLLFNADRAESQTSLAMLYLNLGQPDKAESAFTEALRLQPKFVPAYVNFAHYYQSSGKEQKAFNVLQAGLKNVPDSAGLYHALGLWHIRNKQKKEGIAAIEQAARLDPDDARYQYVYAVALAETDVPAAIRVLETSRRKHTGNLPTLEALAYYYEKTGQTATAEFYRQKAEALRRFVPRIDAGN